ncbi:hypothetical protein FF38_11256 [Lucilia cuprina]|uniref:Uncharacterized protein n=1 Tax=Lucilia cuprina TaxID=7375 RepID=A0A0L0BL36_LUCCU|nr:Zinc finger protein 2 [Lucilia cuprina]KNC20820.1 hypothetical protein FF38_11256 [Lucilia cuprina]
MESDLPICRVCLNATNECIDFQAPFQSLGNNTQEKESVSPINYLECLRLCTNLPIEEFDDGPQCLCTGCATELQIVYKFLEKAQSSQSILEESWQNDNQNNETMELTEIYIEKFDMDTGVVTTNDNVEILNLSEPDEDLNTIEYYIWTDVDEEISVTENEPKESSRDQHSDEKLNSLRDKTRTENSKYHKCHICGRTYKTVHHLKVHLNYHKRRKVQGQGHTCRICGEEFRLEILLTEHMIEHKNSRQIHKCEQCDKEFISKTALISHKRIHQGEPLNCNECGKQFSGTYELKVHLRFHKREKQKEEQKELPAKQCKICNKEFATQRYLNQHMNVHLDERATHKCNYCEKEYVTQTALNNHKRLHEGQTLECMECGKQFTRNYELEIHMRFHKREYPFECTMCDKKFTIKGHLKTHMLQHQNIKLECEECGKLFSSTKALNEHSYTHTEMPYPCEFCNKAYPSKQKYKLHLEKMHSIESQDLDLSQLQSFTNKTNLKKRKNFTYVQVIEEQEDNEVTQIYEPLNK